MPIISRQVGTVSQNLLVFIPDATVSTGAGLANIVASTVRLTWLRSDMAAVSSWTLTTATLGTWSTSSFTQVGSTSTLGMYQVSLPHALFATGDQAIAYLMSSTATMAPVPIIIDLSTQALAVSSLVGDELDHDPGGGDDWRGQRLERHHSVRRFLDLHPGLGVEQYR
jgi:hypothetical protein